ncbi:MAG: hypothetical protein LBS62_01610 [Clostridiales bacterium]|jgi:hypothetical protein|nr:hypothetical protein [Clostridiales bacterium]
MFIRERAQELTGYQEAEPFHEKIDLGCDFVMVYGIGATMPERVRQYRQRGYVVHLMTGIAWGEYQDYLYGKWDGRQHWDESQTDRDGKRILHGKDVPYMVPTIAFADYLTEKLKAAVDSGVEAIHLEEPEFFDNGGYSEAFKREYKLHYRQDWSPPHESLDTRYKASRLKALLYSRALTRVSAALKEYALVKYNRVLRVYVPTHSLLNYTQWKIMSPEGGLIDIPSIDGCIAQVWTGTSRSANVFEGVLRERTFETAYLEYGIMQELVRGTGRDMWFLHDPIEDNPDYDWEDYRVNYLKTVTASLLHPEIHTYEICPWPNRVYRRAYPIDRASRKPREGARYIPEDYASLLNGLAQTLGDMDHPLSDMDNGLGVLMSDTGLYQRTFPDNTHKPTPWDEKTLRKFQLWTPDAAASFFELMGETTPADGQPFTQADASRAFFKKFEHDPDFMLAFIESGAFPQFFGLTLPLLKYGLPLRPVQLDNLRRFPGYLDGYRRLVLSYEYLKPETPDINNCLAEWVSGGGTLFYVGDGSDPYHKADAWWNRGKADRRLRADYNNPAEHLFEMLGLPIKAGQSRAPEDGVYKSGSGTVAVLNATPASFCMSPEAAARYRHWIREQLAAEGCGWTYKNYLRLRRGPYIIACVMEESVSEEPLVLKGSFADIYTPDFALITEKILRPGENTLLYDLSYSGREDGGKTDGQIIGASARVFSLNCGAAENSMEIKCRAAAEINAYIRVYLQKPVTSVTAVDEEGGHVAADVKWDAVTGTALFSFRGNAKDITITGRYS